MAMGRGRLSPRLASDSSGAVGRRMLRYGLVAARIRGHGRGSRMQDARRASLSGLPSPADLFVGRDGELAAVSRMLAHPQTRLVTLTGPPGIGKTRLAVACASWVDVEAFSLLVELIVSDWLVSVTDS